MRERWTRRRTLATLPALAAGVAGCSALQGDGDDAGGTATDGTDDRSGTDTPTGTPGSPDGDDASEGRDGGAAIEVEPWHFLARDAAETGRIEGSVPTTDLTERWSQTKDLVRETIVYPCFNRELLLLAFRRRETLLFVDHAGQVVNEVTVPAPWQKFGQPDGFLVESRGAERRVFKFDNDGERVFRRTVPRRTEFEPHPEPDVLAYDQPRDPIDGPRVKRVGVYDLESGASRWRNEYVLERPAGGGESVPYRLVHLYVDAARDAMVFAIAPDGNVADGESRGALVCLDLASGEERWRLDGVSRTVCNLSAGRVLSGGISWDGDSEGENSQYLRSYHVTDVETGEDRRVADIERHGDLFRNSGLGFDDAYHYLVGDRLYATDPKRLKLVALDLDGSRAWEHEPAGRIECRPRAADNALVLGTNEGLEFVGFDGSRLGTFELDDSFEGGIMLTPGRVYAAGSAMHAIDGREP